MGAGPAAVRFAAVPTRQCASTSGSYIAEKVTNRRALREFAAIGYRERHHNEGLTCNSRVSISTPRGRCSLGRICSPGCARARAATTSRAATQIGKSVWGVSREQEVLTSAVLGIQTGAPEVPCHNSWSWRSQAGT